MGNRLHLAFKRQVPTEQARAYAEKNCMTFFEVSPLCNFNVIESFTELSRIVLMRHGMEKIWRPNRGQWGQWGALGGRFGELWLPQVGGVELQELHPPDVEKCLRPDELKLSQKQQPGLG